MTDRWIAEENNYYALAKRPPIRSVDVGVIIPAFNHPAVLERTLAGFLNQTTAPASVVVADDGSTDDLSAVVDRFADRLAVRLVRQEFEGNGAGPARNLGASLSNTAVLLFIDSDCIPHRDLVAKHVFWHERATNVAVAGSRFHVDAGEVTPDEIAAGRPLDHLALTPDIGEAPTEDWRRHVGRRHRGFTIGSDGYRAAISSNLSVDRAVFAESGGFSETYVTWGGEDTEFGWRIWNAGTFLVPDRSAVVYHQTQHDPPYDPNRQSARVTNRALMSDRIPEQFYRKRPSAAYSVPKLSWIAAIETELDVQTVHQRLSEDHFGDVELILVGPSAALERFEILNRSAQRTRVVIDDDGGGFERATISARGEYLLLHDARVRFDARVLTKALHELDRDTGRPCARLAYRVASVDTYRRLDEIAAVDRTFCPRLGAAFALLRRRDLLKDRARLTEPTGAVAALSQSRRALLLINDHAELPADMAPGQSARLPGPAELASTPARELARAAVRTVRKARPGSSPPDTSTSPNIPVSELVGIDYIGYAGAGNFGDEAMLLAVRQLMPWADIRRDHPSPSAIMVGGGTLINVKGYYLNRLRRNDSPTLEKIMFGTGVRNPDFWGITEDMSAWTAFMESALYAGVRGPHSVENLRALGHPTDVEILGDAALTLTRPDVARVPGRVVVCPVWTDGELHGGSDQTVFDGLASTIRRLSDQGHEVVMLSAYHKDDRWIIQLMRDAGLPDMPYVPAHFEVGAAVDLIASADLVIAERLHAGVIAASVGTPFVPIEYRPKTSDFAASVGVADLVVRTDEIGRIDEVIDTLLATPDRYVDRATRAVDAFRQRQQDVADRLHSALTHPDPQPWIRK